MEQPIRKSFTQNRFFPFEIVYKDTKNPQNELPDHFHEWYEIVYVYKGKGTFFIDQSIQFMNEGDLFILPGNVIHYAIPDKENPVTSTAIFFDPLMVSNQKYSNHYSYLQIFDECVNSKNFRYVLNLEQRNNIVKHLDNLYTEITQKKLGYIQAITIILQSMLLYSSRSILQTPKKGEDSENSLPNWFKKVLDHIELNFTNQVVDLVSLSEYAEISPEHLSRVFKKMTGMNVSEYITSKKILLAKERLIHTNDTVETVAKGCGFNSMPHFHRTFRKYFGMTPSNYRKR
ncbi:AraC family transcriptional regulator [Metabacillus arenae]|uniref:Helix-turn-helix domain-containing protein n=1 Tax=Metabacillus arenae TaxID=2771434 RepID=A0A926NST3_9BACI|nr:AraC family transcriptional regulator [Metabacillus arenae]MBD1383271.1 helix-turn-helix domain-containing protein [Metabacillus arenae]